ncbi:hypothetical protein Tco_1424244 [Tanacetum coccineum]
MVNGEQQLQALVDGKKIVITEASVRRDLQLDDEEGTDCLPNATSFEELTIMGYEKLLQKLTFYKAFFSPQWKFFIRTILQCLSSKTTAWNGFSSTMASAIICLATNKKFNFSKYIFESMVKNLDNAGKFMMSKRKDTQLPQPSDPTNIADEAVNKEPRRKIHDIDANEDITLENVHDAEMFDENDLHGDEVFVEKEVSIKEVSDVGKVNIASIATIVNEEERSNSFDEQETIRLQAEFDEEVRIAREKVEASVALIEEWNDIQAKIETDYELAQRLQAEEQEELIVKETCNLMIYQEQEKEIWIVMDEMDELYYVCKNGK